MTVLSFTSCVKQADMNIDPSKSTNVVEFANTGDNVAANTSQYPRFNIDLGKIASGDSATFNINLSYSGADVAPEDISIQLEINADVLSVYNTENGTDYEIPVSSIYNFPTSIVIKKGTKNTQIKVAITSNADFDFNKNYALPLKIKSASTGVISGNFGAAVYSFAARNQYDGIYTMSGTLTDIVLPSITGWYPIDMQLITYTGNSIALYDGINYTDAYGHPIKSGTSGSYYGSFSPVFFFDNTGKITNITNYYGQESGGNLRSAVLDPTGINKITFNTDGSINYFEVSYIMTQSVSSPNAPRTYFKEKFTYKEAR